MTGATIAAEVVLAALANVPEDGGVRRAMLIDNGIRPEALENPGARVQVQKFANLLRDAMIELQDEQLGYGVGVQPPGTWTTMAQYALDAENLGDAIRRLSRFYRFVPWGVETRCEMLDENTNFTMRPANPENKFSPYLYESFLFYYYQFCCWLTDYRIPVLAIGFNFESTSYSEDYVGVFSPQRVDYLEEFSFISFSSRYNSLPIKHTAISIKKMIEHANLVLFNQYLQQARWAEKVEQVIAISAFQNNSITSVALQLCIHPHTLRRRLKNEGRQFAEVRDKLRLKLAMNQLKQTRKSIEDIAIELGYSETSAFSRAFKRWTKLSPQNFRDQSK
ncbi:AraC family transcriptional regulator [Halioxenophilus aromaticivorans]|uniref:AraC family transcriptional regulator n=1 Tax=Halioxenophilus aromaticivorans TaxID=1306992 RepID=A0AAV3U0C8_9ALTE